MAHRIDTEFAGPGGTFVGGNPSEGIPPTQLTADWFTDIQENYVRAIENEAIAPVKGDYEQLSAAIRAAAGNVASLRNRIINGGFDVWQRATFTTNISGSAGPTYVSDRWLAEVVGSQTGQVLAARNTMELGALAAAGSDFTPTYNLTFQVFDTTSGDVTLKHRCEHLRAFAGGRFTFSFYAKSDSPILAPFVARSNFGSGGSAEISYSATSVSIAGDDAWARYTVTVDVPQITSSQSAGAGSYVELELTIPGGQVLTTQFTAAQFERNAAASQFDVRPLEVELALCRRYFEKSAPLEVPIASAAAGVFARDIGTALRTLDRSFTVEKRAVPTVEWYATTTPGEVYVATVATAVTSTQGEDTNRTGWPVVGSAVAIDDLLEARWTADAELG